MLDLYPTIFARGVEQMTTCDERIVAGMGETIVNYQLKKCLSFLLRKQISNIYEKQFKAYDYSADEIEN